MNSVELQKLRRRVEEQLTEKRMKHTLGVVSEAVSLARQYGADVKKAELAALSHDMARCKSASELEEYIQRFGLDSRYSGCIDLAHSKIAAKLLEKEWGVEDEDVLNAVAWHTTGRPGMSLLEKIIYLADVIEPGRNHPGVERLREVAYRDLDEACAAAMEQTIEYLKQRDCKIEDSTIRARDALLAAKGEKMSNKEIALKTAAILSEKKAQDLLVIDITGRSSFADYLVLATGGSERQVGTLASEVTEQLAKEGILAKNVEGKQGSGWILMDYGDIIVNIFSAEQRSRYNIEKIWGDCCFLDIEENQ